MDRRPPLTSMLERMLRSVRRYRGLAARWSPNEDQAFHDDLFGSQSHDAFSRSYAGYLTIRRFADLAETYLRPGTRVLDLGCGLGEITCELARRQPSVQFFGVDHSEVAISRARATARRFGLAHVSFEAADVAAFAPAQAVDLVLMFDSFHHLLDPAAFVRRMSSACSRFFLIEPAGDALGRWRRTLDFDWVASELDKIRSRIEFEMGIARSRPAPSDAPPPADAQGRAVEHRYPLADYESFFDGFVLNVRGTVAGLDMYPPDPTHDSRWRSEFMDIAYALLARIDDDLMERQLDLYAKHWAIYASRDNVRAPRRTMRSAPQPGAPSDDDLVKGPFDAQYEQIDVPSELARDAEVTIDVTVVNNSWRTWSSASPETPVFLSYHWRDTRRNVVVYDGVRTPLPRPLEPAGSVRVALRLRTPPARGVHYLEIDLVEEGISWFSAAGVPPGRARIVVR